jgi:hypothetical protein
MAFGPGVKYAETRGRGASKSPLCHCVRTGLRCHSVQSGAGRRGCARNDALLPYVAQVISHRGATETHRETLHIAAVYSCYESILCELAVST